MDDNRRIIGVSWGSLFTLTILASFFYIFSEWFFLTTKPSFMDQLPLGGKLGILFTSALLLIFANLLFVLLPYLLSLPLWRTRYWKIFLWVGCGFPAFFLAAAALLMVDNFTYTIFKFGIISTQGLVRGIYGTLFFLIWIWLTLWIIRTIEQEAQRNDVSTTHKVQNIASTSILMLAILLGGINYFSNRPRDISISDTNHASKHPNILLIGSDGLDVDHLSLYGYDQETTPFLEEFAENALVAENNFPNANMTTGSHVSMLTGKLPTTTRTLFPPDILKGENAYQHLPGILKNEGYYNAQISVYYYGDANALNFQDAFVSVNGSSNASGWLYLIARRVIPEDSAYFLSAIETRLSDRIGQIYYISTMKNPYAEVSGTLDISNDRARIDQTISLFRNIQQPLFIHLYMMGTHKNLYDSYDDAIRSFDGYVREVTDALAEMGKLDQTMIVVYTDHGQANIRNIRTPLIIRFPNGEYAGKITHNTQILDIAPTILDYIGIKPPEWMAGQSLIRGEPPATRPIFSAIPNYQTDNGKNQSELDLSKIKPPFYQFGFIDMVICHEWYSLDTSTLTWQKGTVEGYPTPCNASSMPDDHQAEQIMVDQLRKDGFDITSLETSINGKDNSGY